jgi:hypothetical protein
MAPEQIDSPTYGPVSPATDIYAMGTLLYQMFSGKPPFHGTLTEVLHGHLQQAPPPLRTVAQGFGPPDLERVVRRALAKRPVDRWPSAHAFRAELLRIDADIEVEPRPVSDSQLPTAALPPRAPTPISNADLKTKIATSTLHPLQRTSHAPLIGALALVAVLIAGGGIAAGWYLSRQAGEAAPAAAPPTTDVGYTPEQPTSTAPLSLEPVGEAPATLLSSPPPAEAAPAATVGEPGSARPEAPITTALDDTQREYVVKTGESLSKIAFLYSLDVRDLQWWNEIKDSNNVFVGQMLHLYQRPNLKPKEAFFASIPRETPKPSPPLVSEDEPNASRPSAAAQQTETKDEKPKKQKSGWWPFRRKQPQ